MKSTMWAISGLLVFAWGVAPIAIGAVPTGCGAAWQEADEDAAAQQDADDDSEQDADAEQDAEADQDADAAEEALSEAAKAFKSIEKEFNDAMAAFMKEYTQAKPADRAQLIKEKLPQPSEFAGRFMTLADQYPDDPAAFESLVWIVTRAPDSEQIGAAMDRLLEKYTDEDKMADVAMAMAFGMPGPKNERALRTIIDQTKNDQVKGAALYSLAGYLMQVRRLAEFVKSDPEMKDRFDDDIAQYMKDFEYDEEAVKSLYQRVIDEFSDVEVRGRPLAERAESALFELEYLSIGKVAPDIEGEDFDGESFKLSDYRGKIVMLDFWGDW